MATVATSYRKVQPPEGSNKNQKRFIIAFCITLVAFLIWGVDHRPAVTEDNIRAVDLAMKARAGTAATPQAAAQPKPAQPAVEKRVESNEPSFKTAETERQKQEIANMDAMQAQLNNHRFEMAHTASKNLESAATPMRPVNESFQVASLTQPLILPPPRTLQSIYEESQKSKPADPPDETPIAKVEILRQPAAVAAFSPPKSLQSIFEESQKSKPIDPPDELPTEKPIAAKVTTAKAAFPPPRSLQSLFDESQSSLHSMELKSNDH